MYNGLYIHITNYMQVHLHNIVLLLTHRDYYYNHRTYATTLN